MSRSIDMIKFLRKYMDTTKCFQRHIGKTKYLTLNSGACKAEFTVTQDHLNEEGRFHSGMTATLVDVLTAHALLSYGKGFTAVSSNIHVSYLEPAYTGDSLSIEARVLRIEHPLAYVEVEISKNNKEDAIVARGQQTLFIKPIDFELFKKHD